MSGFDTQWLDLREPADRAGRNPALLAEARSYLLAGRPNPLALDLGSGTGATLRAFGPVAGEARWRLLDNDPRLLAAAIPRLQGFPHVERIEADLTRLPQALFDGVRLVTASALFDLTSYGFVADLAARLAQRRIALYAALNYDGRMAWDIPHSGDAALLDAFNAHQTGDKGFGPALGPAAGQALRDVFEALGYAVRLAPSPWRLGSGEAELHAALLDGFLRAVTETGRVAAETIAAWREAQMGASLRCEIGHWDVLALPPSEG